MDVSDYIKFDGLALAELVQRKEVTAAELVSCARQQVADINPSINAVIELFDDVEDILEQAPTGQPFSGVPFLIKDLVLQAKGRKHEAGSRLLKGNVAREDSELMLRFKAAGLLNLGRTAVPEFGLNVATETLLEGACRNPWDTDRSCGGSSGGSAAAVAAGIVPLAHANDGGGSIRCPAACCGLVGLKPSRGRVSAGPYAGEGLMGFGVEFAVTRSIRDAAALLDLVQGNSPGDPYPVEKTGANYFSQLGKPSKELRIAFTTRAWSGVPVDPQIVNATEQLAKILEQMGHQVEQVSPEFDETEFSKANTRMWSACIAQAVMQASEGLGRPINEQYLEPPMLAVVEEGSRQSAIDLLNAKDVFNRVCRSFGQFFESYDLLLTPTLAQLAWPIGSHSSDQAGYDAHGWIQNMSRVSPFTAPFNCTGQPAISLPLARSDAGLPIGMQLVAGLGREDQLLRISADLEQAMPWPTSAPHNY